MQPPAKVKKHGAPSSLSHASAVTLTPPPCVCALRIFCSSASIRACHAPRPPPHLKPGAAAVSFARTRQQRRANATKGGVSTVCEPLGPDRPVWFPGKSPPAWLDGR
jgi:light-harvesting complex I chlorophyll a/b binding protein 2